MKNREHSEVYLLVFAGLAYLLYLLYLTVGLGFQMLAFDVLAYWSESLRWQTPFNIWWVPGYPLLIAAVRGISFGILPPIVVMLLISAVSYLVAVGAVYRFTIQISSLYAVQLAVLFALFPLVGLTYAVYPIADITAIALLMLSVISFERREWGRFVLLAGASMFVHKVMWFFLPPLMLVAFARNRESRLLLPLAFVPLLVWGIAGALYHRDLLWFMRWSVENLIVSKSSIPIFDGLITPLPSGSAAKMAKGAMVAIVLALALVCGFYSYRYQAWLGLCISVSVLLMITFVNSYEIWAVVRFSKLLVIPLSLVVIEADLRASLIANRFAAACAIAILLASNMAFGLYMARFYVPGWSL